MKTNFKIRFLVVFFSISLFAKSQVKKTYYTLESTVKNANSTVYAGNIGDIILNNSTNDLIFLANLADLKTGDKNIDSLQANQKDIPFTFKTNLGTGLLGFVNEPGDETYHKVIGTMSVNNVTYQTVAYIKIENVFKNLKTISKTLISIKLQFAPVKMNVPYLASYFTNAILLKVNNSIIYQNI